MVYDSSGKVYDLSQLNHPEKFVEFLPSRFGTLTHEPPATGRSNGS
jgi:hypothetical protein